MEVKYQLEIFLKSSVYGTYILVLKTSTENPATTRKGFIMIFLFTQKVDMKY